MTSYVSYDMNRPRRVTAVVERLAQRKLVAIGSRSRLRRPWSLTDAGQAELARHEPREDV